MASPNEAPAGLLDPADLTMLDKLRGLRDEYLRDGEQNPELFR